MKILKSWSFLVSYLVIFAGAVFHPAYSQEEGQLHCTAYWNDADTRVIVNVNYCMYSGSDKCSKKHLVLYFINGNGEYRIANEDKYCNLLDASDCRQQFVEIPNASERTVYVTMDEGAGLLATCTESIASSAPSLSEWGLIILSLLLLLVGIFFIQRKLATPSAFCLFLLAFTIAFYFSARP